MAAYADVRSNLKEPTKCLEQNVIATSNLLESMRQHNVKKIVFASSATIYGEPKIFPTSENIPLPAQTSLYGASKLSCEGMLEAYAIGYGFNIFIFRFVSLMGERYSHGCTYDFYKSLMHNPKKLLIHGNGQQKKSYLYVKDAVEGIFYSLKKSKDRINIFNLGNIGVIDVNTVARIVSKELGCLKVEFEYTGGKRGWAGDSPFVELDISKMEKLGWKPSLTPQECVQKTVQWINKNRWILKECKL